MAVNMQIFESLIPCSQAPFGFVVHFLLGLGRKEGQLFFHRIVLSLLPFAQGDADLKWFPLLNSCDSVMHPWDH
jgi:hypothetical protein